MAASAGKCGPEGIAMQRSEKLDSDVLVAARFIVSLIDSGGQITLREGTPDIARALSRTLNSLMGGGEAIGLILNRLFSIPEAARLSGYTEADILSLIERGELGGLCIDGVWLISRGCAQKLPGLADAEKWFQKHGYKGFKKP
jgi:hypothetical protein